MVFVKKSKSLGCGSSLDMSRSLAILISLSLILRIVMTEKVIASCV